MKMNLTTNYAIRAIKAIYQAEGAVITSKKIAQDENISHGVLMKILNKLKVSGIVLSHQGRGEVSGGFTLSVSPKEITLLDILTIMEGGFSLTTEDGKDEFSEELGSIDKELKQVLQNCPLEDLWMNEKSKSIAG